MGTGNFFMRGFQIGAGAMENFWRLPEIAPGSGSAEGLGLSDRFNRYLCYITRFGIESLPVMPSYCEFVSSSKGGETFEVKL